MLEVRHLNIITNEDVTLVDDLSFILNTNDKFAVIGHEGNGKSTLLKAILDPSLLPHCHVTGNVTIKGKLGYLEQDIKLRWTNQTVYQFLLKEHPDDEINIGDYELLSRLAYILNQVHFPIDAFSEDKEMSQFSGGEAIKLGLTKLLLHEPDIILLDEPSNDLDFQTIEFLENFIQIEMRPILFVSHDETLLEHTANGIIHLNHVHKKSKAQSIFTKLSYQEYKDTRLSAIESKEMIARKQRKDYQVKMEKFRQIYQKAANQQDQAVRNPTLGRLLKKKIHSLKSMEKRLEKEADQFVEIPEHDEAIQIFFDSSVCVHRSKVILDFHLDKLEINNRVLAENIHLYVKGRQKIALIGENGVGKSTLLKEIHKQLLDRGDLSVGYMSQTYEELFDANDALSFLLEGQKEEEQARIRKMMGALQFKRDEMRYPCKELSGGQKAKLLLLKMVIDQNNVLILDEPTRNLSPLSAPEVYHLLDSFNGAIICVTHDRKLIEHVYDDVYHLSKVGLYKQM